MVTATSAYNALIEDNLLILGLHLTADLNNLNLQSNYEGSCKVQVSNGNDLPIVHIGYSFIPTIFHVPQITV